MRLLPALIVLLGGALPPLLPQPGADGRLSSSRPDVVWIPGGWFVRGSDRPDIELAVELCLRDRIEHGVSGENLPASGCPPELFHDEVPRMRVWVSAYGMDRTEVSHREWRRCMAAGRCPPPRVSDADPRIAQADHPVTGITWDEAQGYCEWVGGRLPTEAEWERAARGHDDRPFPWGRLYNDRLANHGRSTLDPSSGDPDGVDGWGYAAPVGSYSSGRSPYGLLDMAGNAREWTADLYEPESYLLGSRVDPHGPAGGGRRVVRGGSWRMPPFALRVTHRERLGQGNAQPDLGFRCAHDGSD